MFKGRSSLITLALVALCVAHVAAFDEEEPSMDRFCTTTPNGRFVPNPRSCQHWIFCRDGQAIEGRCDGIFYFDVNMQMCRYPAYVDCTFDAVDVTCRTMDLELHPHPENCNKYVACIQGFPRVVTCAPGLHWNAERQECNLPEAAGCGPSGPGELEYQCQWGQNYVTVHPHDCAKFIICINGQRDVSRCANGLLFDPENMRCDREEVVNCISPRPDQEPEVQYNCDPTRDFYLAPHPHNCELYLICVMGSRRVAQCADGLIFDWITLRCNTPNNGFCLAPRLA